MSANVRRKTSLVLRIALAAVLIYAGIPKLMDPGELAGAIQNYRVLPEYAPVLAVFVPVFELVIALGLLTTAFQRGACILAGLMLLVFALAMAQARARGIDLRCGCFGAALEAKVSWWTVARSGVLSLLAFTAFALHSRASAAQPGAANETARGTDADPPVLSP
ncbi:MAG TPA: MauE/DoxX family redox-associated membrane protein [Polyangiales bacterium]|nr:MauE/DoxX family redox-associated membrane protein [Polyangiales bacterium]